MGKKSSPAPDYTPVAQASKEATQVSEQLAREQMAEARRQYEDQKAVAQPIVDAQLQIMRQGIAQGEDYYNYMKEQQRPIEQALQQDALKDTSARDAQELGAIESATRALAGKTTELGGRQAASGEQYAQGMRSELGAIAARYGLKSDEALAQLDADLAKSDGMTSQALAGVRAAAAGAAGGGGIRGKSGQYEGQINSDIGLYTGGNDAIRSRYGKDIDTEAEQALADARAGQAQAQGSAIRQALRYGLDPSAVTGDLSVAQATQLAQAANGTRTAATSRFRDIVGQGIGMRQNLMNTAVQGEVAAAGADTAAAELGVRAAGMGLDAAAARAGLSLSRADRVMDSAGRLAGFNADVSSTALGASKDAREAGLASEGSSAALLASIPATTRQMRMQNDATQTAKKMDIAGMYRGLAGASQGAYGMAAGAGTSANVNNSAAGNTLMSNMAGANQLQMSGRQLAMQGLGSVLSAQTSYANANPGESFGSVLGGVGGAAAGISKLYGMSDRRVKSRIVPVERDPRTGLQLYEFEYAWAPGVRFRGVMADEVAQVAPEAVVTTPGGTLAVDYQALGLEMAEA